MHKRKWCVPCLVIAGVFLAVAFFLIRCSLQTEHADTYLWKQEIPDWLSFTGFTAEEIEAEIGNSGKVTAKNAKALIRMLHLSDQVEVDPEGYYLKRQEWVELYRQFLDYYEEDQITETEVVLLKAEDGILHTVQGAFQSGSIPFPMEEYYGYTLFCQGNTVLGVGGKLDSEIVLENEYVVDCSDGTMSFLCDNTEYQVPAECEKTLSGVVADLVFSEGKIVRVRTKEEQIRGKLLALTDTYAEIQGYGQVPCSSQLKFYSTYNEIREADKEELQLENMEITCVVAEGQICAFLMQEEASPENIRVLLLNGQSPYYENVYISGEGGIVLSWGEDAGQTEEKTFVCASDYEEQMAGATVFLSAADGSSPLYLTDEAGVRVSNGYQGRLELRRYEEGYTVVNVLPIEIYLKGVIASEMPASYELEALKCQAVCARSYAYRQLMENHYAQLGAHVDDSTNYQVYNKSQSTAVTDQAVDETAGQVLCWNGRVIQAFYYSTSYGHSGDYTAWNLSGEEYPYLSGYWLRNSEGTADLSDEAAFAAYISQPDPECPESDLKFFRWRADLDFTGKEQELYRRIQERKSIQPEDICCTATGSGKGTGSAEGFGALTEIRVAGRNESGVIEQIELLFEKGSVGVTSEYNMRYILAAGLNGVTWQDGSVSDTMTLLPSSYFSVTEKEGGGYTLQGGGYGHGLGMSQNGAQKLAAQGWTMQDILQKFYPGASLDLLNQ